MAEIPWICPKKKLSLAGIKSSLQTDASSLPPNSKLPLRSVAEMMADYPCLSPKKTCSSAGVKRSSPSEASSPPPKPKVIHRPYAAMVEFWKHLNAEEENVPHAQAFLRSHPSISPTASEAVVPGFAGSVEEAPERRIEDTSSPSPPKSPLNFPSDREIEEDIAGWEDYLQESNQKWHEDNPYR